MRQARTSSRATAKRSRKPTGVIVGIERICPHDPETWVDMGNGHNPEGEIFFCATCRMLDKFADQEITSLLPLKTTRPMREKI